MGDVFAVDGVPFANGDVLEVQTVWDMFGYDVSADFSALDSTYKAGAESVESSDATYTIVYELSGSNKTPDGEGKSVVVEAVDVAGNRNQFELLFALDNTAPSILSVASGDDNVVYKNGDTVTLLVKLDGREYKVSADFSALDSN